MKPADDQMEAAERRAAREAHRAGREREFETLAHYLHRDPRQAEIEQLHARLPWSGATLQLALASLRRRVRELARRRTA
jgi:hypothetical protein